MRKAVLLYIVALGATLWAQVPGPVGPMPPIRFPAALRLYLELSDTQVENIIFLNADYQRWAQAKQRRMSQVQQELDEEMAKEPLDPMAIGLAAAELEATRRQMKAELDRTRTKIRAVLSERQQTRLKTLEDALKLWPIYSEAVGVNLLEAVNWGVMPLGGVVGVISQPAQPGNQP